MPTINGTANFLYFLLAFLSAAVAGAQSMDWSAYFEPQTALAIVGGLNGFALFIKSWLASVELAARTMTATEIK